MSSRSDQCSIPSIRKIFIMVCYANWRADIVVIPIRVVLLGLSVKQFVCASRRRASVAGTLYVKVLILKKAGRSRSQLSHFRKRMGQLRPRICGYSRPIVSCASTITNLIKSGLRQHRHHSSYYILRIYNLSVKLSSLTLSR